MEEEQWTETEFGTKVLAGRVLKKVQDRDRVWKKSIGEGSSMEENYKTGTEYGRKVQDKDTVGMKSNDRARTTVLARGTVFKKADVEQEQSTEVKYMTGAKYG